MLPLVALALLPAKALSEAIILANSVESLTLPNNVHDGPIIAETVSTAGHIDWPKLLPGANDTSYDWWYFDVVSSDARNSVTFVFYNTGPNGFVNEVFDSGPLSVSLSGVLPNGSDFYVAVPATGASFSRPNSGGGVATSAVFHDIGFSWNGTDLGHGKARYVLAVDAPHLGVTGTVSITSVAPARYPCGPGTADQTELAFPGVYWSVPVPGAEASVDLLVDDTEVKFHGVGYHDKNWGAVPFVTTLAASFWGHAQVGPYSLVWANSVSPDGRKRYYSGYVAKDGKVLTSSCGSPQSALVRPWGRNSVFAPWARAGATEGLEVLFELEDGRTFWANVTNTAAAVDGDVYFRSLGTVTGGIRGHGEKTYRGAAVHELFNFMQ